MIVVQVIDLTKARNGLFVECLNPLTFARCWAWCKDVQSKNLVEIGDKIKFTETRGFITREGTYEEYPVGTVVV